MPGNMDLFAGEDAYASRAGYRTILGLVTVPNLGTALHSTAINLLRASRQLAVKFYM